MNIINFIIYGFSVWRISNLFVNEDGPFFILRKVREWTGIRHDSEGGKTIIPDNFLAQIFSCTWCCSLWVAGFLTILWVVQPRWSLIVSIPFALSAFSIFLTAVMSK